MKQLKAEYLPEVINKTRLARIQAERRLLFYDHLGKAANAAFACWTALFALFSFIFPDSKWLAFATVGASVTLAIISAYTSAQNFGVRAAQMRANYIGLHELWLKLDSEDARKNCSECADVVGERYLQLLLCSENHAEGDYKRACQRNLSKTSGEEVEESNDIKYSGKPLVVLVVFSPALLALVLVLLYKLVENACI